MSRDDNIEGMLNLQQQMQREKLKANNHKGGWEDMRPAEILFRAEQEMEELRDAVRELMRAQERGARALVPKLRKRVIEEATDVSDFMGFMMHNLTTVGDQMHFLGGNVDRCGLAPTVPADDNVTDNTCDVCGERCPGCDDG